jgi:hypothetical protein
MIRDGVTRREGMHHERNIVVIPESARVLSTGLDDAFGQRSMAHVYPWSRHILTLCVRTDSVSSSFHAVHDVLDFICRVS